MQVATICGLLVRYEATERRQDVCGNKEQESPATADVVAGPKPRGLEVAGRGETYPQPTTTFCRGKPADLAPEPEKAAPFLEAKGFAASTIASIEWAAPSPRYSQRLTIVPFQTHSWAFSCSVERRFRRHEPLPQWGPKRAGPAQGAPSYCSPLAARPKCHIAGDAMKFRADQDNDAVKEPKRNSLAL